MTTSWKLRGRAWAAVGLAALALAAPAQLPPRMEVKAHPQIPLYRDTAHGQIMDAMITFESASTAGAQEMLVSHFDMRTFKDGDTNLVQLFALAPQCLMNLSSKIASDPGPLQIFTPTTNLYIEGRGFYCDQSQRLLILSNDVQTRIVKSLLKAPLFGASNAPAGAGQMIRIFSDYCHFDSQSNVIDYIGNVRVFDPQGDSTSRALRIYLTTNNAVQSILWRDDVAINVTNRGRATAQSAFYAVTNGAERMRLSGDAVWRNGAQEAKAGEFNYDSLARTLQGSQHVRVRWPNPANATNSFAELFSDEAVLQWPPTDGPIESMTADGNVILVNQSDQSRATAQHAFYSRPADSFKLTGDPVWWNDQTEVRGDLLTGGFSNRIYRAEGSACLTTRDVSSTNRSLQIACDHLNYQTNLAEFHDQVVAKSFTGAALQDTLTCRLLTVNFLQNKVQSAVARGDVRGETIPDALGAKKTLRCETLTLWRSVATGLLQKIVGQDNVVVEQLGGAKPATDILRADTVTALFSPVTNRLDQAIAENHVIMDQRKNGQTIHATAERAVYAAGTNAQITLTGQPLAQSDKYTVADADSLIWTPSFNALRAIGPYRLLPVTPRKSQ